MHLIFRYVRPYLKRMSLGLVIKFTGTIMDLLLPYILAHIIDDIVPLGEMKLVVRWGLVMAVCSVLAILGNVIANRMAAAVARDTTRRLRHDLFRKISYLSNRQIDGFTVPSLVSRMTTDTYNINRMVGMMQRIGIRAPILVVGGILVTLTLEPILALVLCTMLPIILAIVFFVSRKSIPMFDKLQQSTDNMVRVVRENASGVRVIKALSRTEGEKQRFEGVNRQVMQDENRANMVMAFSKPAMNLTLNIGLVLVVLVGAVRVNKGLCGPGAITAFLTYFTIILNAMMSITRVLTMWSKALASAERIEKVLTAEDELTPQPLEPRSENAHIVFDHVSFSYNGRENNLEDIHFSLERGESLGVIGPTGAGKSTLAALLMRFYDVQQGAIRVDGRDVKSYDLKTLRDKFGVVFQNDILFKKSIGENIRIGRELDMTRLEQAAKDAQAAFFIQEAGGMSASLEARGVNLSGGQKQRLLIARALAGWPDVLILDDSSSALDYQTDARLRQTIHKDYGDTTAVIIAQRVSSVKNCDKILVLEEGRMAGFGTHEELLNTCALYQEISRLQMGEGVAV
ncbi:MAG: ABC transporter ATP-binding protein [Clostridia bacterium]|nr:ABC transporter ATP-binding protein [Clostridia bacterium]